MKTPEPKSMAGTGTHEKVLAIVAERLPVPSTVIDLGAGEGALAAAISRMGHDVTGVDCDAANWKAEGVDLIGADLNGDFSEGIDRKFDAVVAVEILEHVENPFLFLRESAKLLAPGGLLFLTTPNVESISSRLVFLYTGRLEHFGEWETVRPAHITPIFRWKLLMALEEAGFVLMTEEFNRERFETGTNLKGRLAGILGRLLVRFVKRGESGECRIIAAKLEGKI